MDKVVSVALLFITILMGSSVGLMIHTKRYGEAGFDAVVAILLLFWYMNHQEETGKKG